MKNVKDFEYGAIGDGQSHPLSDYYSTLSEAQQKYPHATSLNNELDWAAVQLAINKDTPEGRTEIIVPPGDYLIGDLKIDRRTLLRGFSTRKYQQSVFLVPDGKNGILIEKTYDNDGNKTDENIGTTLKNITVKSQNASNPNSHDGIRILGTNGVILQEVTVINMGQNGVSIIGNKEITSNGVVNHNSNNWQILNCQFRGCLANGLSIQGQDSNAGTCTGLHVVNNRGWGIYDNSFLGNVYISCQADSNHTGSYYIEQDTNYSTFIGCYHEDERNRNGKNPPPDFRKSDTITIVGGNLASSFTTWDQIQQKSISRGAVDRYGYRSSKAIFKERKYLSDKPKDYSEIGTRIPVGHGTNGYLSKSGLMSNIAWYYKPPAYAQEFYDKSSNEWIQGKGKGAHWHLNRFVRSYNKNNDGEAHYEPNSMDRCWHITEVQPVSGGPRPVPFGWTDRQHPLNGGHFFFGNSIANQKNYFSWKQEINESYLQPGNNIIKSSSDFPFSWLSRIDLSNLFVSFSIEFRDKSKFVVSKMSVGSYLIESNGKFEVIIMNHNSTPIDTTDIFLNCHFESFEIWPDNSFKK